MTNHVTNQRAATLHLARHHNNKYDNKNSFDYWQVKPWHPPSHDVVAYSTAISTDGDDDDQQYSNAVDHDDEDNDMRVLVADCINEQQHASQLYDIKLPEKPVSPAGPGRPAGPRSPVMPMAPVLPVTPAAPGLPVAPLAPVAPVNIDTHTHPLSHTHTHIMTVIAKKR